MTLDRTEVVYQQWIDAIEKNNLPEIKDELISISDGALFSLFDSQLKSRFLDIIARELKAEGHSYYTIGSSGHEGNAVLGQVFPYTDIAFLHYRSGAFFIERAKQQNIDAVKDILLSLMAAKSDPISSGRHKVFGSKTLHVPPQTSTIASHLPKALGCALSLMWTKDSEEKPPLKRDSVVICSFGDASFNHASAQTTFNACARLSYAHYPLPIIFLCEDNGIGISVPTPDDWIKSAMTRYQSIHYLEADGRSLASMLNASQQAQTIARIKKQPVFLHMRCRRLLGHAGSDIEQQYLTIKQIKDNERQCPLLYSAATLLAKKITTKSKLIDFYHHTYQSIKTEAKKLISKPKLSTSNEVLSSIIPKRSELKNIVSVSQKQRQNVFKDNYEAINAPRNFSQLMNLALTDILLHYPNTLIFGEDVGKKGGVYRVTKDLQKQFGKHRVFDTLLDETTILGTAIGMAHNGFLPIPEIQFLAYLHNAEDQLRGEAATLSFFSSGQYQNPMVIRIPGLAYQKGFGGHFHNDNSIAVLRDIPGLIIACPSNGFQAVKMLRECVHQANTYGRVVVFIEPIALYMTKDLHQPGDGLWQFCYPKLTLKSHLDEIQVYGEGELVILSYANGLYLSLQAQKELSKANLDIKVIDIQWLSPLPMKAILKASKGAKAILVVDEGRRTGSVSEALMTLLLEQLNPTILLRRITGEDTFIPLGNAWQYVLPSKESIIKKAQQIQKEIKH